MKGSKTNDETRKEIKRLWEVEGIPQRDIATKFELSLGSVNYIINDRRTRERKKSNQVHPILGYVLYD